MRALTNDDVAGGVAVGPADKGRRLQEDDVGCLCPRVLVLLKLAYEPEKCQDMQLPKLEAPS